jgi:ubiquinone/menaquinone biosynthesis C-methylase UbiE
MTTPHRMKQRASDQFEAWAHSYDRSLLQLFLFQPAYQAFLETIEQAAPDRGAPVDLLDIGCGTGTFAAMLAAVRPNARVVGLDYAEQMARGAAAKAHQAQAHHRVRFLRGDSEHLPFADASFDFVTCSNSFHHYPHQQACVAEMARVLRPGGRLVLIDGFRDNVIGWITFDFVIAAVEKHVHHASWTQMRTYFQQAGLADIEQRKLSILFPLLLTTARRA